MKKYPNDAVPTALAIAGSDCSGGAGIFADIKTMTANGVYAMGAITALTVQNTMEVTGISEVSPAFLKEQLDAIFTDIVPKAVKIGMISSSDLAKTVSERLRHFNAQNIVADPVMVATSGASLVNGNAVCAIEPLLDLATLVTPNILEAQILSETQITDTDTMQYAAEKISKKYRCAVLLKGGHNINDANDLLCFDGDFKWFFGKRIDNPNTHGTGCTLSSAIAANLAKGYPVDTAVFRAKEYISGALEYGLDLGKGSGPLMHMFDLSGTYIDNI